MTKRARFQPADRHHCRLLADALGDTPETVIAVHLLTRGLCHAYVAGNPARFEGAIVQATDLPTEPTAFGDDPDVLWALLRGMRGWTCVNVARALAPALGAIIEERLATPVRYLDDVYHVLHTPVAAFPQPSVRLLTSVDLPLLRAAPPAIQAGGFGSAQALLAEGIVAGAVIDGRLVATAHTAARSVRHADLGVATLPDWRGRGLATSAAALVARAVQAAGQAPVWSAGAGNAASLRVARKLGFKEVSRRAYVVLDRTR